MNVSSVNCSRISEICVREFVCVRISSKLLYFFEQVPIAHNREREQCNSLFHIISLKFLKEGQGAMEGKVLNCTHTLPLRKTSKKGTKK